MKKILKLLKSPNAPTVIRIIILIVPVVFLIVIKAIGKDLNLEDFFSISTFCTLVSVFLCKIIADFIIERIEAKNEDSIKLTEDYDSLIKKYSRADLLKYKDKTFPAVKLFFRTKDQPSFELDYGHGFEKKYKLPSQVASKSDYLMKAHRHSKKYNKMNLRLDDLKYEDGKLKLFYSQTYYYDSLITNRAMDYPWENGKTIREIYEPGPFLSDLSTSKLSNHLGFNGFVETSDGKIVFVLRGGNLTIGKNTWGSSVAASFKTEYALNSDRKLDDKGISNAIKKETEDELYINLPENADLSKSIFAFYRDIVEGGKPQFLFYYRLENCTYEEFEKNFREKYNKSDNVVDGERFIGLTVEELSQCKLSLNGMEHNGRFYKMTSSTAASLAMLIQYLKI